MKIKFDSFNRFEQPDLTLCNPGCVAIDGNNGLDKIISILYDVHDFEGVYNFNAISEINFRIYKDMTGDPHLNKVYNDIKNRRLIYINDTGFFTINSVKSGVDNGTRYKDVSAQSCEAEIENKNIPYIPDGTYRLTNDETDSNQGLLNQIVATIPLWTIGHVDDDVASLYRTFEDVDTTQNCLSFMMGSMQDAYECIFIFDIIRREINVYSQKTYVRQTDIHISNDDFIKSLDIDEDSSDLFTAITAMGSDDTVTIAATNPLGGNTIYNFDYYLNWMSDGLREKVISWQNLIEEKIEPYREFSLDYYTNRTTMSNVQAQINAYQVQIDMYTKLRQNMVATNKSDMLDSYNTIIVANGGTPISTKASMKEMLAEIDSTKAGVQQSMDEELYTLSQLQDIVNSREASMNEIREMLSMPNYFSEDELNELDNYIYEGSYTDEYVITTDQMSYADKYEQMVTLYDRAVEQLKRASEPTQEFSVDVENFVFVKEFSHWTEQLETGCLINVELEPNDVAELFLSSINVNYEDCSLKLTFGNRFNKYDTQSLFDDVLGNISKTSNSLTYVKNTIYPIKNGSLNQMQAAIENSRNLTMNNALSADTEDVVIDASGYTGRTRDDNGNIDPRQVKIVGNAIVFTDDGWQTSKIAIGEMIDPTNPDGPTIYGVNAQMLVGDMIIGNGLSIKNDDGSDLFTAINNNITARLDSFEVDHVYTGNGFSFDERGLIIFERGSDIRNRSTNEGMYVERALNPEAEHPEDVDYETVLEANYQGVDALNLHAKQYLVAGSHARFEDYGDNRTGCFYLDGAEYGQAMTLSEL